MLLNHVDSVTAINQPQNTNVQDRAIPSGAGRIGTRTKPAKPIQTRSNLSILLSSTHLLVLSTLTQAPIALTHTGNPSLLLSRAVKVNL